MTDKAAPTDDERAIFARNVAAFREELAMSQQDVAQAVGMSVASIYRYESAKGLPEREGLLRLAKLFGRTVEDCFNPAPPPPDPARQRLAGIRFKIVGNMSPEARSEAERAVEEVLRRRSVDDAHRVAEEKAKARAARPKLPPPKPRRRTTK